MGLRLRNRHGDKRKVFDLVVSNCFHLRRNDELWRSAIACSICCRHFEVYVWCFLVLLSVFYVDDCFFHNTLIYITSRLGSEDCFPTVDMRPLIRLS
jgi:hypothetical protein